MAGLAVTATVQLAPGATTVPGPQPDTRLNCAVSMTSAVWIDSGALPLFVNVTFCGTDVMPMVALPKSTVGGSEQT
jgi:hypothetical protein